MCRRVEIDPTIEPEGIPLGRFADHEQPIINSEGRPIQRTRTRRADATEIETNIETETETEAETILKSVTVKFSCLDSHGRRRPRAVVVIKIFYLYEGSRVFIDIDPRLTYHPWSEVESRAFREGRHPYPHDGYSLVDRALETIGIVLDH